eukprot:13540411-Alexandrium_andersonii.AAC.1
MRVACGDAAFSPEHDGIAARGDARALLDACAQAVAPLRVAVKEYPSDPLAAFRERFPQLDWDIKADTSIQEYEGLLQNCRGYVASGSDVARANTYSFAKLVAARLSPVVNVPVAEGDKRTHFE